MPAAFAQPTAVFVRTRGGARKPRPFISAWAIGTALVAAGLPRRASLGEVGRHAAVARPLEWVFWNAASLALGAFSPVHRPCVRAPDGSGQCLPTSPSD